MPRSTPVLNQVNLVVSDMEATVAFYRRLGLEVPDMSDEWRAWQAHHRSANAPEGLTLDFDSVAFAKQWNAGLSETRGGGAVIGFRVGAREDVDALYADMTGAGYRSQQAPYDAPWGARHAIIEDPDGNAIGLMSDVDPAMRSHHEPPA